MSWFRPFFIPEMLGKPKKQQKRHPGRAYPCGGVTKRLDTVSRREGKQSIEGLDSALFRIKELVDYRASFDGQLILEARTLCEGLEPQILCAAKALYPDLQIAVNTALCRHSDRPMYLGKRHVVQR